MRSPVLALFNPVDVKSFENLISTVISYGGDADTIGSMAGAITLKEKAQK